MKFQIVPKSKLTEGIVFHDYIGLCSGYILSQVIYFDVCFKIHEDSLIKIKNDGVSNF